MTTVVRDGLVAIKSVALACLSETLRLFSTQYSINNELTTRLL